MSWSHVNFNKATKDKLCYRNTEALTRNSARPKILSMFQIKLLNTDTSPPPPSKLTEGKKVMTTITGRKMNQITI